MFIAGLLIKGIIIVGIVILLAIALVMWLNSHDSSVDNKSYDENFDAKKLSSVAKYKRDKPDDEDMDVKAALKRYEHPLSSDEISERAADNKKSEPIDQDEEEIESDETN